ncbi:MAG: hypothetical protein ACRCZF_19600, partial [Gemmataceae bacterium]
ELAARWQALPPASLRPRRAGETFFVVPVKTRPEVIFDPGTQQLLAPLTDPTGGPTLVLIHPFTSRGAGGLAAALAALQRPDWTLKFVAGTVRRQSGYVIDPVNLVFDTPTGRQGILPWLDPAPDQSPVTTEAEAITEDTAIDTRTAFFQALSVMLEEVCLVGLQRYRVRNSHSELQTQAEQMGYGLFARHLNAFFLEANRQSSAAEPNPAALAPTIFSLLAITQLARDID